MRYRQRRRLPATTSTCSCYIPLSCCHPGGIEALGIADNPELASRLEIAVGTDGRPTGWITGSNRTISDLFNKLPRPSLEQQMVGTRAFFRTLNSLGITGVLDPGGYNLPIEAYRALFRV